MNAFKRGWLGGIVVGFGGALALVTAALAWIAWEDLR